MERRDTCDIRRQAITNLPTRKPAIISGLFALAFPFVYSSRTRIIPWHDAGHQVWISSILMHHKTLGSSTTSSTYQRLGISFSVPVRSLLWRSSEAKQNNRGVWLAGNSSTVATKPMDDACYALGNMFTNKLVLTCSMTVLSSVLSLRGTRCAEAELADIALLYDEETLDELYYSDRANRIKPHENDVCSVVILRSLALLLDHAMACRIFNESSSALA